MNKRFLSLFVAYLFCFNQAVFGAIAFDSVGAGGFVTATSLTYAHNVGSGENRLLVVGVVGNDAGDNISGATYNGAAMTLIDKQAPVANRSVYMFYLLNPASGNNNVVVTSAGSGDIAAFSVSYTGVKQSAQPDATNKHSSAASATILTSTVTTVANNSWMVVVEGNYDTSTGPVAGLNSTFRSADPTYGVGGIFDSNGSITPAGNYYMTTIRNNLYQPIYHISASFAPATGDVPPETRRRSPIFRK